jgi:chromosome segregation ATPase
MIRELVVRIQTLFTRSGDDPEKAVEDLGKKTKDLGNDTDDTSGKMGGYELNVRKASVAMRLLQTGHLDAGTALHLLGANFLAVGIAVGAFKLTCDGLANLYIRMTKESDASGASTRELRHQLELAGKTQFKELSESLKEVLSDIEATEKAAVSFQTSFGKFQDAQDALRKAKTEAMPDSPAKLQREADDEHQAAVEKAARTTEELNARATAQNQKREELDQSMSDLQALHESPTARITDKEYEDKMRELQAQRKALENDVYDVYYGRLANQTEQETADVRYNTGTNKARRAQSADQYEQQLSPISEDEQALEKKRFELQQHEKDLREEEHSKVEGAQDSMSKLGMKNQSAALKNLKESYEKQIQATNDALEDIARRLRDDAEKKKQIQEQIKRLPL